ncbi:dGTPase [Chthoniobacter flavus Ellin428]|uniref:dGTPase n=1 Tax=Chthoniobacter flavus Ellin428 TaxID=497964 RepID=B4D2J5_9BACT|nr:dNTP triphosphohydrolase [Chthoniobacter flavus]EDY19435.1 dGTPase [Chthoniobacter flavus Ellin428]TCO90437.1 putative deoxyguanosinetriphosphate triphosphohydrolase [Chthoniobacter flavus]
MDWKTLLCQERTRETHRQTEERRSEIVRDHGRAVFSTPVRRLQDKAQVFPLEPIDAVRTRLTHSMEVSSVARDLAHAVAAKLFEGKIVDSQQAYEIEMIAATVGLIHDIGNPPFGHAGEKAIQDWFEEHPKVFKKFPKKSERLKKDFLKFEGNAQTIRLLAKLQILSDRSGLNLTYATLSAACKYTANSLEIGKPKNQHDRSKLGYFTSEDDLIKNIRSKTGTAGSRNPITFLAEASDDIVYSAVDVEDGVKKGVLSWGERQVGNAKQRIYSERSIQAGQIRAILDAKADEIGEDILADTPAEFLTAHSSRHTATAQWLAMKWFVRHWFD